MNIKVILRENVPSLGKKGDVVEITKGYARNYLFPKKLAKIATAGEVEQISEHRQAVLRRQQEHLEELKKIRSTLQNKRIAVRRKASSKGKLYASVTPDALVPAIFETYGWHLPEDSIKIAESIKSIGLHSFKILLPGEGDLNMKVKVIANE